jgi:hypothetical protein
LKGAKTLEMIMIWYSDDELKQLDLLQKEPEVQRAARRSIFVALVAFAAIVAIAFWIA